MDALSFVPYESDPRLQDIVCHGTLAEVRACVRPRDKEWRGQGGQSLLFWAAKRGGDAFETVDICRFLVETIHLEVDLRSAEERPFICRTALFLAARHAPPQVTAYLLERRANPNREDRSRQTPLFFAVSSGSLESLELLLRWDADANHQDQNGQTPLFYAAKAPHASLTAALLRHIDNTGGTAAAAVSVRDTLMMQTPLFYAAKVGTAETCALLIEKRSNVDGTDKNGQSALFWAAREGRADFIQLLLDFRATADLQDNVAETPLFYAADHNRVEACRVLMEQGNANPCLQSIKGHSPADLVFKHGAVRPPELVMLFQVHADPSTTGRTQRRAASASTQLTPTKKRRKASALPALPSLPGPSPAAPGPSMASRPQAGPGFGSGTGPESPSGGRERSDEGAPAPTSSSGVSTAGSSSAPPPLPPRSSSAAANDGLLGDLPRAILRGTPADVRRLVSGGHDPRAASAQCGTSIFSLAVMRPDKDDAAAEGICRVLVEECGLLPRCSPTESPGLLSMATSAKPAFLHSVQHGLIRCAAYLLQVRCDVHCKNEIGQTPLFIAAGLEAPECLAMLLDAREDPNSKDPFGRTPLFEALIRGHVRTVELLIHRGAIVDVSDREGKHAVDVAAPACLVALVAARCDLNLPTHSGHTPLCVAARQGSITKVQALLEARADATVREQHTGRTALHVAVDSKHLQVCRVLMESDADASVQDAAGISPLTRVKELRWSVSHFEQLCRQRQSRVEKAQQAQLAAKQQLLHELHGTTAQGPIERVRELLRAVSVNELQEQLAPKLLHDAANRHPALGEPVEVCRLLIEEARLDPCGRNETGQTPLFSAAWTGHVEVCNYLIQQKCDVDDADNYGRTALFCASSMGQRGVVRTLLQMQAEVDWRDTFLNQTALFFAAKKSAECVSMLLTAKAEAGALDKNDQTALFYASGEGVDSAVRMLVHARADVNWLDNRGLPALFYAIRERRAGTASVLLDECNAWPPEDRSQGPFNLIEMAHTRGLTGIVEQLHSKARIRESLLSAAKDGSVEDVDRAITQGASAGAANAVGWTALHCAAARQDTAGLLCVRRLLEAHGAKVNALDRLQQTPLFIAARNGSKECLLALLDHQADPRLADENGETALFGAAQSCRPDIVTALLEQGVPASHRSTARQTAAFCAARAGSVRVLAQLLDNGACAKDLDAEGRTALFGTQDVDCAQLLLDRHCSVDACDRITRTALFEAEGHNITRLLLSARASVTVRDQLQQTPIFPAAARGDVLAVRLLLEAKADGTALDGAGQTVLFGAASRASVEMVKILISEGGADPAAKDLKGQTAAQAARRAKPAAKMAVADFLTKAARAQTAQGLGRLEQPAALGEKRVRYRLAFVDPTDPTGATQLQFGSPAFEEALLQLAKENPWLKMDLWFSDALPSAPQPQAFEAEVPSWPQAATGPPQSPVHV